MKTYFMTTARLGFSQWAEGDLPEALELWGSPEVAKYISANGYFSEEQIAQRLEREIKNGDTHGIQYWPIYLLETGRFAGCCGLRPHDEAKRMLEMGVHLLKDFWGKGLATEACGAVIARAFDNPGTEALFAGHNPKNESSAKLLRNLGFVYTHDEFYEPTGLYHPSYLLKSSDFKSI